MSKYELVIQCDKDWLDEILNWLDSKEVDHNDDYCVVSSIEEIEIG